MNTSTPDPRKETACPSIDQCLDYFDRYAMFDNIRLHSFTVARVAETLLEGLSRSAFIGGQTAARNIVVAGALLHDIAKTMCIENGCRHAAEGQIICNDLGYPEIGEIVAEHVVLKNFTPDLYKRGIFGPKELVFYADKRVLHDQVVPLSVRLEYIIERYGDGNPVKHNHIRHYFSRSQELEKYIFSFLDFRADDLATLIPEVIYRPAGENGEINR